ncbi:MAG: sigma-54 dependent transcriptional regulator [Candidatus Saganbacteria bacterium]|nr:sigma-54 dependent transcriptional regulator [Candidatus Saganbacteria bacterium]
MTEQEIPVVLAIDDESDILSTFKTLLKKRCIVETASSGEEGLEKLKELKVPLVLLDVRLPGMNGIEVLKRIKKTNPDIEVLVVSALPDVKLAVDAIKLGAYDYIVKPFDANELINLVSRVLEKQALVKENLYLKEVLAENHSYCKLFGKTPVMKRIFEVIETVAKTESTVLITGESGTGKELVAHAIHKKSNRPNNPFIVVNCAAIPETLLESELFGHEKGAFTGALERRIGKFELADNGTIFLDEIGCMPPAMQSKLLRIIQDGSFERIGGTNPIRVNVRILSASNIDFNKAIEEGNFREDLYHRLNVIPIQLPPLRERKEDIPLFISHFLETFSKEMNKPIPKIEKEAMEKLTRYDWPGNVRELQNLVERMVVLIKGDLIKTEDLPLPTIQKRHPLFSLKNLMEEYEKNYIKQVLKETGNNHTQAAKALGLHRSTLLSKLKNYRLL